MPPEAKALCYYFRKPPSGSGAKPIPYRKILGLIQKAVGGTRPKPSAVFKAVKNFKVAKAKRGRKMGWRKTTAREDGQIFRAFLKVRKPHGCLVESRDVSNELPDGLRGKVCLRTIRERLRERGFQMGDKKTADDQGDAWRKRRIAFCEGHAGRTTARWSRSVQAVGDFQLFTWYPKGMRTRHRTKSCPRTNVQVGEK